jgi:cytidylate kinase
MANQREKPVVAIDGPAGAGKSTLAAHLARKFGFLNLETGAMYRALALKAIDSDLDLDAEPELLSLCERTRITLEPTRDGNRVLLDGMDVSRRVRDRDVTAAASRASVHPRVRHWMVEQQRLLGAGGGVVMEGRDIGTAVFPDAEVKIFLDAAPEVRGNRRYRQVAAGEHARPEVTEEALLAEMRARDERDRNRAESPLKAADDAVTLDSTALSLDEVLARSEEIVRRYLDAHEILKVDE